MLAFSFFDTPLHPILVNFSAALIPLSFASDALAKILRRDSLATTGWWMLFYAALITPATAATGWWWYHQTQDQDRWEMTYHFWLGFSLVAVVIGAMLWRLRSYRRSQSPSWTYLLAAAVLVAGTVVQGHLGGMMSFGSDDAAPSTSTAPRKSETLTPGQTPKASETTPATAPLQWRDHIDLKE
jgi:uncharacterized membrane protein